MRILLMVATFTISFMVFSSSATACSWNKPQNCLRDAVAVVVTVATAPVTIVVDVAEGKSLGTNAGEVYNSIRDVGDNVSAEAKRVLSHVGDAGTAIAVYVEATAKSPVQVMSNAERRIREGKIIDAIWHAAIADPLQNQSKAAARATQESQLVNIAAQTAASAYGGPGGAAAYAAWYTYNASGGDAELALRAGIIAGMTKYGTGGLDGTGGIAAMPTDDGSQLALKAIVAGAVGGAAVAAAGGDEEAVMNGFILAGGMVLIQDGYKRFTEHDLDAKSSSNEPPYCMSASIYDQAACAPPSEAWVRDENGNIVWENEKAGIPKVDVRKVDVSRSRVGTWAAAGEQGLGQETGVPMQVVSKIPGMNAMALFHDHWAVTWDMNAFESAISIVPAVVLTYIGTGAPLFTEIQDAAIEGARRSGAEFEVEADSSIGEESEE